MPEIIMTGLIITYVLPITLIIPVYKVKYEYFKMCLESIAKQTQKPKYIIIIDDGNCDIEIDNLVSSFKKKLGKDIIVEYIKSIKNNGISIARNLGLNRIKTPWISFLDADDWIKENYFELLYKEANNVDVGIIACSCEAYDGKTYKINHFFKGSRIFSGEDLKIIEKVLINQRYLREGTSIDTAYGVPWGKLYHINAINGILFDPSLKRMEDNIFNHQIIKNNPDIVVHYIDKPLYVYRTNHITAYNAEFESDITSWLNVIEARKALIQSKISKDSEIEQFFYREVVEILAFILNKKYFHKENPNRFESFLELRKILNDKTIKIALKKECKGTPIYRNMMLKLLRHKMIILAFLVNRLRGRS